MFRGEIWLVDLPESKGSIQAKLRPCVIVSNNMANRFSPVIHVCPISSKVNKKNNFPTHVELNENCGMFYSSIVLCEQSMLITKDMLIKKIGKCDSITLEKINNGLSVQFGLIQKQRVEKNKLVCV